MNKRILLATSAALALGISGPAFAQFTLNGTAVPADQVDRIQQHCDMLQSLETTSESGAGTGGAATGTTGSDTGTGTGTSGDTSTSTGTSTSGTGTTGTTGSDTGTSGTSGSSTSGTSTSGTSTSGTSTSTSGTSGDTGASASGGAQGSIDFETLDLSTIDIEACREGGFLPGGSTTGTGGITEGITNDLNTDGATGTDGVGGSDGTPGN